METVNIIPEMKDLMDEIIRCSLYKKYERTKIDEYFNDFYNFVNTKVYKYALDDNGFVIRKDCHGNKRSIYGWEFDENGIPKAIITKINLRKSRTDIKSKKSVYSRIYNALEMNLLDWLNDV